MKETSVFLAAWYWKIYTNAVPRKAFCFSGVLALILRELALLRDGVTFPDMTLLAEGKDRGNLISMHLFLQ